MLTRVFVTSCHLLQVTRGWGAGRGWAWGWEGRGIMTGYGHTVPSWVQLRRSGRGRNRCQFSVNDRVAACNPNFKQRFSTAFFGGRCRKAVLGVCLQPCTSEQLFLSPPPHPPRTTSPLPPLLCVLCLEYYPGTWLVVTLVSKFLVSVFLYIQIKELYYS